MLITAQASMAAKPWGPTLTHLAKAVNTTAVVEVEESAKTDDGYVTIKVIETLLGKEAPESVIKLHIKNDKHGDFVKGEKKLITFSYLRKHPTLRDEYIEDPKGPRILDVRGVTTLAAFDYSDDLKALFQLQSDVHDLSSESEKTKFLANNANLLVKQVSSSSDVRTQRLLIPEILLREDLFSVFTKKQTSKLMKSLASSERGNEIDSLFFDALMKIENTNDKKLAKLAMKKLEQFDAQINLASFEATMVVTALKATTGFGKEKDVNHLSKFVDSNSPAIVKQTIRSMDSISPEKTHEVLAAIELSNNAHRDSKQAVAAYLRK
jgi:hypothetical protein